jgi:hypothetical protein
MNEKGNLRGYHLGTVSGKIMVAEGEGVEY